MRMQVKTEGGIAGPIPGLSKPIVLDSETLPPQEASLPDRKSVLEKKEGKEPIFEAKRVP